MSHGSEKRVRSAHLTIRLSLDERMAIDEAAERAGLMPGSYAREKLLGGQLPRQVRRPPVEKKELARLLGELGKIGGNLNQLARSANTGVTVSADALYAELRGLAVLREAILKALGRTP